MIELIVPCLGIQGNSDHIKAKLGVHQIVLANDQVIPQGRENLYPLKILYFPGGNWQLKVLHGRV